LFSPLVRWQVGKGGGDKRPNPSRFFYAITNIGENWAQHTKEKAEKEPASSASIPKKRGVDHVLTLSRKKKEKTGGARGGKVRWGH